jgi:hypothetical protein
VRKFIISLERRREKDKGREPKMPANVVSSIILQSTKANNRKEKDNIRLVFTKMNSFFRLYWLQEEL